MPATKSIRANYGASAAFPADGRSLILYGNVRTGPKPALGRSVELTIPAEAGRQLAAWASRLHPEHRWTNSRRREHLQAAELLRKWADELEAEGERWQY